MALGAFCIGTNQIDLRSAATQGVAVFNAPFQNTRSVVELALAEIIALTRRLTERDRALHEGRWDKSAEGAHEVRGRTLGIVGYGNIGTQLSVVAENLGMVVFYDTAEKLALGNARRMDTLDELLEQADVVTLHVDGRQGNAGLFGAKQFARMRQGSIFLNLSRGFVVDYGALREAIVEGRVAGAAVDVFPHEPKRKGDAFDSELRGLPNVILTPHIGGSTEEAQEAIGQFVSAKLRDYLTTGSTTLSVNVPNLALEQTTGITRITHLHRNTPASSPPSTRPSPSTGRTSRASSSPRAARSATSSPTSARAWSRPSSRRWPRWSRRSPCASSTDTARKTFAARGPSARGEGPRWP